MGASVNKAQIEKAVNALKAFEEGKGAQSPKDAYWLVITTKLMPDSMKVKPHRIPLKHSLLDADADICLFTKDPQREFKNLVAETGVIGLSKLRSKHQPYEAKRKLCASYDLFLSDDRILNLLPPLLGKAFFRKKKHPAPVDIQPKNFKKEIQLAMSSTFFYASMGVSNSVKIGRSFHTPSQIVDNVLHSLESIISRLPQKWENVHSLALKTGTSPALPIYSSISATELQSQPNIVETNDKVSKEGSEEVKSKKRVRSSSRVSVNTGKVEKLRHNSSRHHESPKKIMQKGSKKSIVQVI
ncbi:hypothetical protein HDU67_007532 [Dinochytrium kinnereticum]|nr:hypothetical protein HDU67_007532 [Dinochytrium kinnereticum]